LQWCYWKSAILYYFWTISINIYLFAT
jgi:hypothetical protein